MGEFPTRAWSEGLRWRSAPRHYPLPRLPNSQQKSESGASSSRAVPLSPDKWARKVASFGGTSRGGVRTRGVASRVRTTTCSTWASVARRGAPGRGSSSSPSSRSAANRPRHLPPSPELPAIARPQLCCPARSRTPTRGGCAAAAWASVPPGFLHPVPGGVRPAGAVQERLPIAAGRGEALAPLLVRLPRDPEAPASYRDIPQARGPLKPGIALTDPLLGGENQFRHG